MNKQIFLWVWIKSDELELRSSVHLVRTHYPDSVIALVGDKPVNVNIDLYIPFKQRGNIRASRVTSAVLHASEQCEDFILMYDDIFLNTGFDFKTALYKGDLKREKPNGNYQQCVVNSRMFLEHHGKPTKNYECHQPQLINGRMLNELMELVEWQDNYHLIKSLYFNWYDTPFLKSRNLKTPTGHEAKRLFEEHRCFSSCGGLRHDLKSYIKALGSCQPL